MGIHTMHIPQPMAIHEHPPRWREIREEAAKGTKTCGTHAVPRLPVLQTALRNASLWGNPNWKTFEERDGLRRVYFDGCMLGVHGKYHPIRKPCCVSTNSLNLIQHLSQCQCDHSHEHETAEGSQTTQTGVYPVKMAKTILKALYPFQYHRHIPSLVTKSLPRNVWTKDPLGLEAVQKEATGLRSNGTWSDESAVLLSELRRTSRIKGLKIKVAELLTLCGI